MGRRILAVFFVVFWGAATGRTAFEERPCGARAAGLAGARFVPGDLWAGVAFPASLHGMRGLVIGAAASPAPFGLVELARSAGAVAMPAILDGALLYASRFGFEAYREHEIGGALCARVTENVSIGLGLRAYFVRVEGYGSAKAFGISAGLACRLAEDLHWMVNADNLNQPRLGRSDERIPAVIAAAIAFTPTRSLRLLALLSRESRFPLETRCGVEFTPVAFLAVRGGFALEPSTIAAGIGLNAGPIRFDYAYQEHPALGPTHTVSVELAPADF